MEGGAGKATKGHSEMRNGLSAPIPPKPSKHPAYEEAVKWAVR